MRQLKTLITISLLGATPLFASFFDVFYPAGTWSFGAEALYWKPCIEGYNYAQIAPSVANNVFKSLPQFVNPDYHWGFRLQGGYIDCEECDFILLDWTYLHSTDTITKRSNNLLQAYIGGEAKEVESATARLKTRYNKVNLRFARRLACGCNAKFFGFAGIRYLDLEAKRRLRAKNTLDGTLNDEQEKSEFEGLGFEVGFQGTCEIGCGFAFMTRLGGVAAIGENKYRYTLISTPVSGAKTLSCMNYPNRWGCLPGVEVKLGLTYTYECGCLAFVGTIGYEFNYYFHAIQSHNVAKTPLLSADFTHTTDIGFGGPYLGLFVGF